MRRLVLGPAILLFVWFSIDLSSQTPASPAQARDTEEIVRLLRQWTDAMSRRDAKALDQLLADDFTFVSPRGRLILKATYVANRDATRDASFATESARFDDVAVRFYDGFAVSTSRYTTTLKQRMPVSSCSRRAVNTHERTHGSKSTDDGGRSRPS